MELRKFTPTQEKYELLRGGVPKVWKQIAALWRVIFDAPASTSLCSCNRTRRVKELELARQLLEEQFGEKQEPIKEEPDELVELVVGKDKKVKSVHTKKGK